MSTFLLQHQSHHGKIELESSIGKGTTFSIFFPVIEKRFLKEEQPVITAIADDLDQPKKRHILLVDDEPNIAQLSKQYLEKSGYTVTVCENGRDALVIFKKNPQLFDLVVTDQAMPHMTGKQLAQSLLDIRTDIPVLLVTGYSDVINEEDAKNIGIRKYLMKPVDLKTLKKEIEALLS